MMIFRGGNLAGTAQYWGDPYLNSAAVLFVLVIAWVAVKFGINITSVVLEMGINFTRRSRVKFTISNTTRVVFIPNFTATHAIPS